MIRRGLTLIELLLALVLLSAVVGAVAAWIEVSARTIALVDESIRWERAAGEVLRLIDEDLRRVSPLTLDDREDDSRFSECFTIDVNQFTITSPTHSASGRAAPQREQERLVTYERNPMTGRLTRQGREGHPQRLLLGGVDYFEVSLEGDESMLTVLLRSTSGQEFQRRYFLR